MCEIQHRTWPPLHRLLAPILLAVAFQAGSGMGDEPPAYQFQAPKEPLPTKPWHTTFIDETARTPQGQVNAGAAWCDVFLRQAMRDKLQKTAAKARWEKYYLFFSWAVWGYLSPDSEYHGNERLIEMTGVWLDTLLTALATKPTDPKAAAKWRPNRIGEWRFHEYSLPLLEVLARPELKAKIGVERIDRLKEILVENVRSSSRENFTGLMTRSDKYINIASHQMAIPVHGWLLTGEQEYLERAYQIVHVLGRDQLPNGMFPYRRRLYGEKHSEFEMMYYHAANLRALYLYWWATGSKEAEAIFRKSIPYYPLILEPPHFFNGGPDIWWKDQWRTFWPHHVAMVAAVTGDGENAAIANAMARDNISRDRYDLILGAHAYQLMGTKGVAERPVRDNFLIEDPDIRGVRLRSGRWSSTFSTGSYTYTRASAMRVSDDRKRFSALHMARPYLRLAPLEETPKFEPDYGTLGRLGRDYSLARDEGVAAVAATYSPSLTKDTWDDRQPEAPWTVSELWLMTDQGLVGLIVSQATADHQAREFSHQYRFITPDKGPAKKIDDDTYAAGDLHFRVWATDFEHRIAERVRRFAMGAKDRRDWQLALSDVERSPTQVAQLPPTAPGQSAPVLPATHDYVAGTSHYSLVEASPAADKASASVRLCTQGAVIAFEVRRVEDAFVALYNPGDAEADFEAPDVGQVKTARISWGGKIELAATTPGKVQLRVPPRGTAFIHGDGKAR